MLSPQRIDIAVWFGRCHMIHKLMLNKGVYIGSETGKDTLTQATKSSTAREDTMSWQGGVPGPRPAFILGG